MSADTQRWHRPRGANLTPGQKRAYVSYEAMKRRCLAPTCPEFKYYGGRGIKICAKWLESFDNFYADMGERPERLSLDRIDNDGNYEPGNCRWATQAEQNLNRRNMIHLEYQGRRMALHQWAKELGFHVTTLRERLAYGHPIERVLSRTPLKPTSNHPIAPTAAKDHS